MSNCYLCGQERKFVKAHAVPEAFFRVLRLDKGPPLLVSGVPGDFPKNAPIGVYDETILCEYCEPLFGDVDHYGIEVLLKNFDKHFRPITRGSQQVAFQSDTADPIKLLRFLLAVLWRSSISKHVFYRHVSLGPYENLAKVFALDSSQLPPSVFDAVLSRWRSEPEFDLPRTGLLDPRPEKWSGVNSYRLYLGEIIAYIKIDSRPFPQQLRSHSLQFGLPVTIVTREMSKSKDLVAMKNTARRSHTNLSNFRLGHSRKQRAV